jgi:chaperonin GroEL (HSP60 family)
MHASTGESVDLIKAGITDPAKVTRWALQNAASILGLFIATSVVIVDNQGGTRPLRRTATRPDKPRWKDSSTSEPPEAGRGE